jgi:two-component system sensor histidine kinase KdpD
MARGTLRIYLGAAPGVGKTYAMLNEGRRRRERGEDVVVGLVETHGRRPTAEQVGDLEVTPRKAVEYRGTTLEELDVDAVLARRPDIALVDELAHTNAPGSRNEKRWQDIDELLEAGIGVISTVNIQHLESLNDVVEQITGMRQQETVPDEVVRRADQLQLVDLASESIRARLARGDIYPAERIDVALANYFRPGNLTALRELALLWVADRVDEGLREYRERHGIERPWETKERVIVAVTGAPGGDRVIRRAARMAQRASGELIAVHVRPQDGLAAATPEELSRQRELVEELGGEYRETVGADIGQTLVETARSLNATQVVLGATRRSRFGQLLRGSVINRVIADSGVGIDVHVISHPSEVDAEFVLPRRRRPAALSRRRMLLGFLAAALALPVLTVVLAGLRDELGLPSVLLLFLLVVVGVSALGGLWPALAAAVAGFLLVNWYFTPPLYTFTIGETENVLALFVFLAVAVVVSLFVSLAARRAVEGARVRAEAQALVRLAGSSTVPAVLDALVRTLGLQGASVLHSREDGWLIEGAAGARAPEDSAAAGYTMRLDDVHVLAVADENPGPDEVRILEAFGRELSASLELEELAAEASTAASLASAGELRSAILSAVSHDLRTPIAAIKASVSSLLQDDVSWTEEARREFLDTIDEEVDRLNGLVGNLLDMSRLQAGAVDVRREPVGLDEVVPAALRSLGGTADGVEVDVPESLPRVLADAGLLERALANIVGNAVRHSPEGRHVRLLAGPADGGVDIRVVDRGGGVSVSRRQEMFLPFQRLGDSGDDDGVGLGLAVAKGFVEAMGGDIEVEETPGGGLTMIVRLKAAA